MSDYSEERPRRRFSPLAIVGMVIGGVALAVLFAFLLGWVVMLLWNWLMPDIFRLPRIGYWQAWGLVLLAHILIKPGYGGHKEHGAHKGPRSAARREWKREFRDRFRDYAGNGCGESGGRGEAPGDAGPSGGGAAEPPPEGESR